MGRFSKVLVANRGEIACRVIEGAGSAGYQTVAVYSDADRAARHVTLADEAVRLGPAPVGESYLVIDKIIDAARRSGADAIHPGYGFLAENAEFAQACADAGIVFIGPSPEAITLMGNKRQSKIKMIDAGVPCVPGYEGGDQDDAVLTAEAEKIGVPVMIKAAAGGGGRGMRLCDDASKLGDMIRSARSEAQNAFGNGELILEKAVVGARHVEIQVFGDTHGHVIHLVERDCSVQRRNQKIVEESPSPAVDPDLRARMGEAAVSAARSINYVGAGTVEFLLGADGAFYFLEMNTRLQVEHPVTELVTGIDLVAWQLRIAQGDPLPLAQDAVEQRGHAIEVRLCAEDPRTGYVPQTGPIAAWTIPSGEGIRVDHGLLPDGEISPYYDSMVAKVIAWGEDRESARTRLLRALAATRLHGVVSNLDLLKDILAEPHFAAGDFHTGYMPQHFSEQSLAELAPEPLLYALAALAIYRSDAASLQAQAELPTELADWHSAPGGDIGMTVAWDAQRHAITLVHARGGRYMVTLADEQHEFIVEASGADYTRLQIDGVSARIEYTRVGDALWLTAQGRSYCFRDVTLEPAQAAAPGADGRIVASSDGKLLDVRVQAGDSVEAGQTVAVLEAMKMEFQLTTPVAGEVESVEAAAGDQVSNRQLLVKIQPASDAG